MNTHSDDIVCTILLLQVFYYFRCIRTIFTTLSCEVFNQYTFRNFYRLHFNKAVVLINVATCHQRKCCRTDGKLIIYVIFQLHLCLEVIVVRKCYTLACRNVTAYTA